MSEKRKANSSRLNSQIIREELFCKFLLLAKFIFNIVVIECIVLLYNFIFSVVFEIVDI